MDFQLPCLIGGELLEFTNQLLEKMIEKMIRCDKYHGDSILVLVVEIILMILESLYISSTPYIPSG